MFKGLKRLFGRPKMDVLVFNDKSTYLLTQEEATASHLKGVDPFSKEAIAAHRETRRRTDNIRKGVK